MNRRMEQGFKKMETVVSIKEEDRKVCFGANEIAVYECKRIWSKLQVCSETNNNIILIRR